MSAPGTSTPAGWYSDPAGSARGRYWNGIAWTDLYQTPGQPFPAGAEPKAPPGTDGNTPWIWLIVVLPVLPSLLLLFVPWGSMFDIDLTSPNAYSGMSGTLDLFLSPFYWGSLVLSWAAYGLIVFFAYRDVQELTARGVPRPFHWAFAFIGGVVYAIGRSVVVVRRTGKGHAPIWAEVGALLVSFGILAAIMVAMFTGMADLFGSLDYSR
ncbi:DUF2510 domain-containing protein [Pseudolysinimonas sp.]|uniref:DUF2510 domain-containing protein n=1 Tax=Pseudolysinimonas sp. TaxID=2680009 RepID=UPI00286B2FD7|nr:DUF2510 domain-containing protein [Pseudolysinimonas sp.]